MRRLCLLAVVAAVVTLCTTQHCPEDLGQHEVTFIPHESNCFAYYRCTKLGPKLQMCPSYHDMGQLCYNHKLQICDWSANVRCATCNPFLPDDGTDGRPSDKPTTSTTAPPNASPLCPANAKRPHANCLKYTIDDGTYCCGQNWVFNPTICLCDLKSNVPSCQPTESELRECNWNSANQLSPLGRFVNVVYADNQPVASNNDSLITAE